MRGLAALARRAGAARQLMVVRGGGGGPLAKPLPPSQALMEEDELIWDDGTANPEPCLDQFTQVSKYGALGWLLGGMSVFGVVGFVANASQPEKHVPWAQKVVEVPPEVANYNADGIVGGWQAKLVSNVFRECPRRVPMASGLADHAKQLLGDFSRVVVFGGAGQQLYASCKVLPGELEQLAAAFGDRDAAIQRGLHLEGRRYEVHRHHPPLVYGRSVTDCEPELSTGIAVVKVERGSSGSGSNGGGESVYIAATYEQPHTSAQALPRLQDFAQRFLAADG
ncbi:hypothetical protein COHA_000951 [Chlorella ohadii]|uniref:Uncharacterized protein n=1 Tax=Chlorella ohadii TaxID=2649997 RepID=A0AAD5DZC4_9CHLO|nr:hypothetical protein COHA_000951 [Chlorella ohadii]